MYSSPKYIMLDSAAVRLNCFWNSLAVMDCPSLNLFMADRFLLIRRGDRIGDNVSE